MKDNTKRILILVLTALLVAFIGFLTAYINSNLAIPFSIFVTVLCAGLIIINQNKS